MSKLSPKNGNIVLKPIEEQEMTYGNIVLPDLGKEKPEMAEVIATSDTYNWHSDNYVPSQLQPGQKVLIPKMGAVRVTIEGEEFYICKETEILSVIN